MDLFNKKQNKLAKFLKYLKNHLYDDIERFIAYRTYDRYNIIKIPSLSPNYYDKDTIMLHGMFDLLVDYVEVELASREYAIELYSNKNNSLLDKIRHSSPLNSFPKSRARELGLKVINFYRNYKEEQFPEDEDFKTAENKTRQFGNELYELYIWWKDIRPNRKDPMDLSGWSDFCDKHRGKLFKFKEIINETYKGESLYRMYDDLTEEEKQEQKLILDRDWELELAQEKEDEEMLIRLVKIRKGLWT